jgi:mannose-6-phosphate isomerase-like protein (cupin superfamily)
MTAIVRRHRHSLLAARRSLSTIGCDKISAMEMSRYADLEPFTTKDGSTIREYLHTEVQSLAEASLTPGQATQRHYHRVAEEIYLIVEGGGTMEVDEVTNEVGPGDAILIPVGAWHELLAGLDGVRLLCCCVPPYTHDDTYFE